MSKEEMEKGTVEEIQLNTKEWYQKKPNYFKIALGIVSSKIKWAVTVMLLISLLLGTILLDTQFQNGYEKEKLPEKNIILTYKEDYIYDELNKKYTSATGLKINQLDYYNVIEYDEVPDIAKVVGIKDILLLDNEHHAKINIAYELGGLTESLNIISMPNVIYHKYSTNISNGFIILQEGSFPLDNAKEIAISKNLLAVHYGYKEEQLDKALGSTVNFEDVEYTIVGINEYDVCYISWDKSKDYGFYPYEDSTYQGFRDKNIEFKKSKKWNYVNETDEMIVYVEDGKEKQVLDKLIALFPAENYYSNQFEHIWMKHYNSQFLFNVYSVTIAISAILGFVILIVSKKQLVENIKKIKEFKNSYTLKKIRQYLVFFTTIEFVSIGLMVTAFNAEYSQFWYVNNYILMLSGIIIYLPSILYFRRTIKQE